MNVREVEAWPIRPRSNYRGWRDLLRDMGDKQLAISDAGNLESLRTRLHATAGHLGFHIETTIREGTLYIRRRREVGE